MKIDILFLNDEMNGHDEYFDNDLFQEYCETHSFEGKKNQILSVPPSYSKNENLTFIIGLGENKENINFYDLGTLIGSKINSDAEIKFLNVVEDTNLIIDGILYVQYKFNNYKSEDDSSVNNITFQDLDSSENELSVIFTETTTSSLDIGTQGSRETFIIIGGPAPKTISEG